MNNDELVTRIREALIDIGNVEEKRMFMGICFMVDEKMAVCTSKEGMLCRIGPAVMKEALQKEGCTQMIQNNRIMKAYVHVKAESIKTKEEFEYWINLVLSFNKIALAAKKKKKKK